MTNPDGIGGTNGVQDADKVAVYYDGVKVEMSQADADAYAKRSTRERMARAMCVADGIDPDARGYGLGITMLAGAKYVLWEAQLKKLDAAIDVLLHPSPAVIEAGKGPGAMCREDPDGAFADMIQAIKDGK